jgi:TM2 domain-containing membrane protein YozV
MEERDARESRATLGYRQRMQVDFQTIAERPRKAKAYLLCAGLGMFGAHRFYLGERQTAIIMLVTGMTIIGLAVTLPWALVDLFLISGMIRQRTAEIRERLTKQAKALAADSGDPQG